MNIYTLNVGQGQFVVVTGQKEAFIVDSYVPISPKSPIINVKGALAKILENKELIGLVITGFDADHFNEVGMKIILNKYRPNWIMYPKYFKKTSVADNCFAVIDSFESSKQIKRHSILLSDNNKRCYNTVSNEFYYEIFSPHSEDMNSSNNCSLVCRVVEKTTKNSYLITGDTECDRWSSILKNFSSNLKSDVLAAPHHGSKNGITEDLMSKIHPHSVLISAGIDNQYGHPDKEALTIYQNTATEVYRTNQNNGISLVTMLSQTGIKSYLFKI
jgi:competence protein ComEC